MKLNFSDIVYSFSYGLDSIEAQIEAINHGHAKRVAVLCYFLGKHAHMSDEQLTELMAMACLHDNALTQYLREEQSDKAAGDNIAKMMKGHCIIGEENISRLPFSKAVKDAILYHHEEANGNGPFGRTPKDTPIMAQFIHMADVLDIKFNLETIDGEKYNAICEYVRQNTGIRFSEYCSHLFLEKIKPEELKSLQKASVNEYLRNLSEKKERDFSEAEIREICNFWIKIIDYKSSFTKSHSREIAKKAEHLGRYYGFDGEKCLALYIAGTVHDLGKLTTDSNILEKPDKLSEEEFKHIQNHAYQSWIMLKDVRGLENITLWAVNHHEKLNGEGYPFGKKAEQLSFEERMMACIDIYQALTEERPYKKGFSHDKTIEIMRDMAAKNMLDETIVEDIYLCFRAA